MCTELKAENYSLHLLLPGIEFTLTVDVYQQIVAEGENMLLYIISLDEVINQNNEMLVNSDLFAVVIRDGCLAAFSAD